jgi:hypothetical protein
MRRTLICLAGALFLCSGISLFAQAYPEEARQLALPDGSILYVTNQGFFSDPLNGSPALSGPGYSSQRFAPIVSSASTVFIARVRGEIRVSGSQETGVFLPGPILADGSPAPADWRWRIYVLNRYHRAGSPDYDDWPAELGAPVNEDGTPRLYGNQQLWWVMNDMDSSALGQATGSTPMGLEVQALVVEAPMEGTLFFRYTCINKGPDTLRDAYVAHFADVDLRDGWTDLTGSDSARAMAYAWQHPAYNANEGLPAAFGASFVQTPRVASSPGDSARWGDGYIRGFRSIPVSAITMPVKSSYNIDALSEPGQSVTRSRERWYALAQGRGLDGAVYAPGSNLPRRFWYDGDPLTGSGWLTEQGIRTEGGSTYATKPGHDPRMMLAAGPFEMLPGDTQQVVIAWVYTQAATPHASVHMLRAMVEAARYRHLHPQEAVGWSGAEITSYTADSTLVRASLVAESENFNVTAAAYREGVKVSADFPLREKKRLAQGGWSHSGTVSLPREAQGVEVLLTVDDGNTVFLAPGAASLPLTGDLRMEGIQVLEDEDFNYVLSPDEAATVFPRLRYEGVHTLRDLRLFEGHYTRNLFIDSLSADSWYPGEHSIGGEGWDPRSGFIRAPYRWSWNYDMYSPPQNVVWKGTVSFPVDSSVGQETWEMLMEHVAGPSTQRLGVRIVDLDALENRWYVASLRFDSVAATPFHAGHTYLAVDVQDSLSAAMRVRGYGLTGFTSTAPVTDGFHITAGNAFTAYWGYTGMYVMGWGYVSLRDWQSGEPGCVSSSVIVTQGRNVTDTHAYPSLLLHLGGTRRQRAYHFSDSSYTGMVDIPLTCEAVYPDGRRRRLDIALLEESPYVTGGWNNNGRNSLSILRSDYGSSPKPQNTTLHIPTAGLFPDLPDDERVYATFFLQTDSATLAQRDTVFSLPFYHEISPADRYRFNPFDAVICYSESIPEHFLVASPYPQPAREWVRLRTDLPAEALLRAEVYDMLGRRVRTLYDGTLPAGRHLLSWNGHEQSGAPAPTGNYFIRVAAQGQQQTRQVLLLR